MLKLKNRLSKKTLGSKRTKKRLLKTIKELDALIELLEGLDENTLKRLHGNKSSNKISINNTINKQEGVTKC